MRSEVQIGPKSLCYGFLNEIMAHPCSDGGPEALDSDVPNLMKDVPRVRKCVLRCGSQSLCYRFLNEIMDHPY